MRKAYQKICLNLSIFLFALLVFCISSPVLAAVEDYQGTYSGTYTGDDNGTWSVSVAETGNGAAYSYSNLYNRPDVGLGSVSVILTVGSEPVISSFKIEQIHLFIPT